MKSVYRNTRFLIDKNVWPPEQPKEFTPLALIRHKGRRTQKEAVEVAQAGGGGDIDSFMSALGDQPAAKRPKIRKFVSLSECLKRSKVTKDVGEILAPLEEPSDKLPLTILIEGAPGIGKTILLKEISYRWANENKTVLSNSELVLLLYLRDPDVQNLKNLNGLIHHFYGNEPEAKELASHCARYLLDNEGKNTTILFDGFDELPEHLREKGFIANILNRTTLPECGIVISSRPHATSHLHENVIGRVDILGFSEDDRTRFIQTSLKDEPEKAEKLLNYIKTHPSIGSLCFIPFNMTALLYLFKQGIGLPSSSTELYSLFICLTISRHLATKCDLTLQDDIRKIESLPEHYKHVIAQLAKFSLHALGKNQIVFTFNDIKAVCPDFDIANKNGFGLLQAVEHPSIVQSAVSLNFVHFSVQEYLAAYHVTCLSPSEERRILEKYFFDKYHLNMFSMYVGLSKGQRECFKQFLSNDGTAESGIAEKFLEDQMKCLQLFKCFYEANDKEMCTAIYNAEVFSTGRIDLDGNILLPHDIECLTIFLTFVPSKTWKQLNLAYCGIGDVGCQILYRALVPNIHNITIEKIELWDNFLTSTSDPFISSIILSCHTIMLWVSINVGLGETEGFFTMLAENASLLEALYIGSCDLRAASVANLFKALRTNNKLKRLSLRNNFIEDGIVDYITQAFKENHCLEELYLRGNWISVEASFQILSAVQDNFTLRVLEMPDNHCADSIKENYKKQALLINEHRKAHSCNVELEIVY